jgi:sporulation protein YlmC with PRC-barrel domain
MTRKSVMTKTKLAMTLLLTSTLSVACLQAHAQVAGSQTVGISVSEADLIVRGWSVKKSILGKPVVNDNGERIGVVHDIIIAPDKSASFAIIAAHQFAGVSEHDVAIPIEQLDFVKGQLTLPGGTREAIKAMPAFKYAHVATVPVARAEYSEHH